MIGSNSTTLDSGGDPFELVEQVRRSYYAADEFVREVSHFRKDVAIPAHNELRYAGHHFLQAMAIPSTPDVEHLRSANNHCRRAMYEAADAGIMSALDEINLFKHDYASVFIGNVVTDYQAILNEAYAAQDGLSIQRKHKDDDFIVSDGYIENFRNLVKRVRQFDVAREELNKLIQADQLSARRFRVTIIWAALGVIVAVAAATGAIIFKN